MSAYDSDNDPELAAALALSMQVHSDAAVGTSPQTADPREVEDVTEVLATVRQSKASFDVSNFHSIMWDSSMTTDSDKQRWVAQGIHVGEAEQSSQANDTTAEEQNAKSYDSILEQLSDTYRLWGLVQSQGGPCGVLAVIQAELLRVLIWGRRKENNEGVEMLDFLDPTNNEESAMTSVLKLRPDLVEQALAHAVAVVLARATVTASGNGTQEDEVAPKARIVLPNDSEGQPLQRDLTWEDLEKSLVQYTIDLPDPGACAKRQKRDDDENLDDKIRRLARVIAVFLLSPWSQSYRPLDSFNKNGGVLLLTMSIVASRGKDRIQREFDDSASPRLTSQFGHCGQELMNVMLTGRAASNVFDNTMNLGEMVCKGIHAQSTVGYLSQLEALRYCEVGSYYKSPKCPLWVVGSTSHFTVLFGDGGALKESQSDRILETCQRAFKAVEGGEENGFIQTSQLGQVLSALELDVGGDSQVQTFAASLEVSGAGIILWDSFWKATSRLMTGATLESVLQGETVDLTGFSSIDDNLPPLQGEDLVGTEVPAPSAAGAPSIPQMETDEQMARRLAREWGDDSGINTLAQVAGNASPVHEASQSSALADEELARKLQEKFDSEGGGGSSSVAATDGSPPPPLIDPDEANPNEDSKLPAEAGAGSTVSSLDFERFGDSFLLCHYNGLRGGTLTQFRVTRLSAVEAVGASIALKNGGQSGSGDLEDVVRTKFPSCSINWLGKPPPFID